MCLLRYLCSWVATLGDSILGTGFSFFLYIETLINLAFRFEDIARGGIRMIKSRDMNSWVRNSETLVEENYGLAHTQQRKNKVHLLLSFLGVFFLSFSLFIFTFSFSVGYP